MLSPTLALGQDISREDRLGTATRTSETDSQAIPIVSPWSPVPTGGSARDQATPATGSAAALAPGRNRPTIGDVMAEETLRGGVDRQSAAGDGDLGRAGSLADNLDGGINDGLGGLTDPTAQTSFGFPGAVAAPTLTNSSGLDPALTAESGLAPSLGPEADPWSIGDIGPALGATVTGGRTRLVTQGVGDGVPAAALLAARDRISEGLDDAQPYAPIGVRLGSFLIYPEAIAEVVATDNVRSAATPRDSDIALELRPSVAVRSDWNRHAIGLDAAGVASFHNRFASEDDRELTLGAAGRLDVLSTTTIDGAIDYEVRQTSRNTVELRGQTGTDRGDVETVRAALEAAHRFNRVDVSAGYGLTRFDDVSASGGANGTTVVAAAVERDYHEHATTGEIGYTFTPALRVSLDATHRRRDYAATVFADGIGRDAETWRLRGGLEAELTPTIQADVALGYIALSPDADALAGVNGIVVDAIVTWQPTALTTVRLAAASDATPTTLTGSAGSITRSVGVEVEHAFRRWLIGTARLAYGTEDFSGVDRNESNFAAGVDVEYLLNRDWALLGSADHDAFDSSVAGQDSTTNTLRLGLRARR